MHEAVLVPAGVLAPGAVIPLDPDEVRHLDVRRVRTDEPLHAMDGAGMVATGFARPRGRGLEFEVCAVHAHPEPPATTLCVGAGDRDRMLWLAEKCTELGVRWLVPFACARTAGVASRLREGALAKLRRRAREACKQSGNPWATSVADITPLETLVGKGNAPGSQVFLADPAGGAMPSGLGSTPCTWVVGPEGGLTGGEMRRVREELGAIPVALAPWVLRFETAAVAAAVATNAGRHGK